MGAVNEVNVVDKFEEKRQRNLRRLVVGIKNRAKILSDVGGFKQAEDMVQENIDLMYEAIHELLDAQRVLLSARHGYVLEDAPDDFRIESLGERETENGREPVAIWKEGN